MNLQQLINEELSSNSNKLSPDFILDIFNQSKLSYTQLSPNTRVCLLTLPAGHEIVGIAQVLDAANDVEAIGNQVAMSNATEQLWKLCGTIAKLKV